jgi:hypothetical protein
MAMMMEMKDDDDGDDDDNDDDNGNDDDEEDDDVHTVVGYGFPPPVRTLLGADQSASRNLHELQRLCGTRL